MTQEIQFIRLDNGEDLIASMDSTLEGDNYTVHNPLKLIYMTGNNPGLLSITLMPWIFGRITSENSFKIPKSHTILMTTCTKEMTAYYQATLSHFEKIRNTIQNSVIIGDNEEGISFGQDEPDEVGTVIEGNDGLEMLKEFLKDRKDKGTLH